VYTPDNSGHRRDDRISLNFSYPLWFGENRTANLTSNTTFNNSHFGSSQIGVNGSLDSENNLNYGISTTAATGGQHDVALNGSYRTPWTTLNGSYSQGEGYRQSGLGASGTLIAHRHGVVFSPESGNTLALIEAKDAAGAMLPGSPGRASTVTATPSCPICDLTGSTPSRSIRKAARRISPLSVRWLRSFRGKAAW
jgi:outer membrane usher protein